MVYGMSLNMEKTPGRNIQRVWCKNLKIHLCGFFVAENEIRSVLRNANT